MATLCTPRHQLPFSTVRGDLDQWFDHFFGGNPKGSGESANAWNAPAALWEDEDNYHVELELPGVSTENVDITSLSPAVIDAFNYTGIYLGVYASGNGHDNGGIAAFDYFNYQPDDASRDDWYTRQKGVPAGGSNDRP